MIDPEFIETVKGEIPVDLVPLIDWDRLAVFAREAVLGQSHVVRRPILDRRIADFACTPFDADGYTTIRLIPDDEEILRLHYTRLLPGRYGLADMKLVDE